MGLQQPDMAVDAGAFVEPAIGVGRVCTHHNHVPGAVVREIGDIVTEGRVAAHVAAQEVAVENHHRVAVHPVEFEPQAAPEVGGGQIEQLAVPADAGRRKRRPSGLEPRVIRESSLDCSKGNSTAQSCGQVDGLPLAVVEVRARGGQHPAGLRKLAATAESEVALRIAGVAEMKAPAEIEQQALARRCGLSRRAGASGAVWAARGAPPLMEAATVVFNSSRRVQSGITV